MQNTHIGSVKKLLDDGVDLDSLDLIKQVQEILLKIYSYHFPEEYFKEDDYANLEILKEISIDKFFRFCKEFGIIPQYLTKGLGLNIFNDIIQVPLKTLYQYNILESRYQDTGYMFTFSRF